MSLDTIIHAGLRQYGRPTVALVLMGGGARTAYQVGVLKAWRACCAGMPAGHAAPFPSRFWSAPRPARSMRPSSPACDAGAAGVRAAGRSSGAACARRDVYQLERSALGALQPRRWRSRSACRATRAARRHPGQHAAGGHAAPGASRSPASRRRCSASAIDALAVTGIELHQRRALDLLPHRARRPPRAVEPARAGAPNSSRSPSST